MLKNGRGFDEKWAWPKLFVRVIITEPPSRNPASATVSLVQKVAGLGDGICPAKNFGCMAIVLCSQGCINFGSL